MLYLFTIKGKRHFPQKLVSNTNLYWRVYLKSMYFESHILFSFQRTNKLWKTKGLLFQLNCQHHHLDRIRQQCHHRFHICTAPRLTTQIRLINRVATTILSTFLPSLTLVKLAAMDHSASAALWKHLRLLKSRFLLSSLTRFR